MSLFGPITDADRRRWQRVGARALAELLDAAEAASLPPVHWRHGFDSTLVGMCLGDSPESQRATFEAWAEFLGGETTRTEVGSVVGSAEFLRTERAKWGDKVRVIVTARVVADEDQSAGEPT